MTTDVTPIEAFLFEEWAEATAFRDAVLDLEDRLAERLKDVGERVAPWCKANGFTYVQCDTKYAAINIAKANWMANDVAPRVYLSVAALFPMGFRKVSDAHPSIWVYAYGMAREEQGPFRDAITRRLAGREGNWVNGDCTKRGPAGHYVTSHGDAERIALAQSEEALEEFVKRQLELALTVVGDVDGALAELK